ncbi:hypothetical protein IPA_00805 [Ignicoccus pacificus DSM 13166]|uniref:Phosphatidic acid phosphatase type 2/haloperoxidase domain-containing protein n=1 Tax=Ignicoccus pacificus DSM 13166 TaxID=940294 RepID=A0A977KCC1_9CREN|nr:hypothetical protein IPA_00805 [Ignicoccus pacificus DSM 13166]
MIPSALLDVLVALGPDSNVIPCPHVHSYRLIAKMLSMSIYVTAFVIPFIISLILYIEDSPNFYSPLLGILIVAISDLVLKCLFMRPRPLSIPRGCEIERLGYPSGHAAISTYLALLVTKYIPFLSPIAWSYSIEVDLSRLVLCKHYPLDLIGGVLLGLIVFDLTS